MDRQKTLKCKHKQISIQLGIMPRAAFIPVGNKLSENSGNSTAAGLKASLL